MLPKASPKNLLEALVVPGVLPACEANALSAWASTFYPFQRAWLFESARFAMCNKSRQIGMSHTTAAAAVLWGVFLGENTSVVSVGEREALEVLDKAKRHARVLSQLGSRWAGHTATSKELTFDNGAKVLALPSSSGGRGYSGNAFLDEFAYVQNSKQVWDGAAGATFHGYRMRVASTPNGIGNDFHRLYTNEQASKGWVKHEFPISRALADGMRVDIDECWAMAMGDPRLFAQMFECSFLDGDQQYIPTELVDSACVEASPRFEGVAYAGLDIGLENDLTSLTVVKADARGKVWEQETFTCKRTSWPEQEELILRSFDDWDWRRICVDSTGLGAVPAQLLQQRLGAHRVEAVPFTMQSKEALATGLYQAFADKRLAILNNAAMRRDICSLRRIVTGAGNIRYDAARTAQGHADRAWSMALAMMASAPYVAGRPGARADYGEGDFRNG